MKMMLKSGIFPSILTVFENRADLITLKICLKRIDSWPSLTRVVHTLTHVPPSEELMSDQDDSPVPIDWSFQSKIDQDLRDSDLQNANLRRAILDGSNLQGSNLSGADLRNASLVGTDLMKCALDGADLRGARLTKAKLNLSNFQDAKLDGADLRGVRGRYAIWRRANWWDAKMNDDLRKVLSKKWPKPE